MHILHRLSRSSAFSAALAVLAGASGALAQTADPGVLPAALVELVDVAGTANRLGSPLDDLFRIIENLGPARPGTSGFIRRLSRPDAEFPGAGVQLVPPQMRVVANSKYDRGGNDGLLWAGRGVSTAASAGLRGRWGPLSLALAPEVAWQQNADMNGPDPFGASAFASAGWGASHVRLDAHGLATGFSAENLWWGPAARYPLLLSSAAPGFPHLFLGTSNPLPIGIGTVEAEVIWGGVTEHRALVNDPPGDRNTLAGFIATFSPGWLNGVSLGAARTLLRPSSKVWAADFGAVEELFRGVPNETRMALTSFFGRWMIGDRLHLYGEWVPEIASDAYMVGFQNIVVVRENVSLRVHAEAVTLPEGSRQDFYTHFTVPQGYTNRGESLGTWIGTGGGARYVRIDALTDHGMAGLSFERVADRYYPVPNDPGYYEPRSELTFALHALTRPWRDYALAGSLSRSRQSDYSSFGHANWALSLELVMLPRRNN